MGTWAAITKLDAPDAPDVGRGLESSGISVAVVDTNAIIAGLQLDRIAETAVTIPEVLSEVRDKQTRQALSNLPFTLQCQQPSEESVKAVLRFARATGDLHSLSTADIRLIALAHTLEVARHGNAALKQLPDLPSVRKGNAPAAKELPGWNVSGGKWADMDALTEEELAEQELAGLLSKVSQAVQALSVNSSTHTPSDNSSQQLARSPDSVLQHQSPASTSCAEAQQDNNSQQSPSSHAEHADSGAANGDDGGDWQKASSSHNAARKKKRKQQRRAAVAASGEDAQEPATAVSHSAHTDPNPFLPTESVVSDVPAVDSKAIASTDDSIVIGRQAAQNIAHKETAEDTSGPSHQADDLVQVAAQAALDEVSAAQDADKDGAAAAAATDVAADAASHSGSEVDSKAASDNAAEAVSDTASSQAEAVHIVSESSDSDASSSAADSESDAEAEADTSAAQSSVASVTADFAMQNVILQMGLRLVAPDGMRIKQLSRWVLRCSACFKITKEPGRLFCPHCGNATLDKVEAVLGPDGTEQYGVRKRFNTRGTRYSLPKPKGGSQHNAPILREDVLMQKLNKRRNRKVKDEAPDAFAPEYGPDSWFQKNHGSAAQYKGAAAALASWRHNPNERRHTRTNRRKK